ncbi:CIC11C00000000793 [Sungouiella intermedia]|uniref:Palmitoyltransferase n=1 Tax=Sungouiella intermedia TaxID=45354 RepID=A0A1L0D851_9ASCO|nr:CIC11C00000000793 [[Candida] intermedia]
MHTTITTKLESMLITQPSVMWTHGRLWLQAESLCCFLASLFPKVFVVTLSTWALYVFVTLVESGFHSQFARLFLQIFMLLLYILTIYTYFKVIIVGPGSPVDFPELKIGSTVVPNNPYELVTSESATPSVLSSQIVSELDSGHSRNSSHSHVSSSSHTSRTSHDMNSDSARLLNTGYSSTTTHRSPPAEIFTSHSFKNNAPAYRWCSTCQVWKPDRCHHCSTCNKCFLRMDHHCPWFACCIGFYNQKFFVQVLVYITVFCLVATIVSFSILYQFFVDEQWESNHYLSLNLVFLFVVSLAFSFAMVLFTGFSIYMLFRNTTTIEFQDNRWGYLEHKTGQYEFDSNGKKQKLGHLYDLGWRSNWISIMGPSWIGWLFPTTVTDHSISGNNNGINFEVDEDLYNKYCYNAQLQDQLNQQLAEYRERDESSGKDRKELDT